MSAAEAISKNSKIKTLLIEKNRIGEKHPVWVTWPERLEKFGLGDAISHSGKKMIYYSTDGSVMETKTNLSTVNEKKLLNIIKNRINRKNCKIFENCELLDFEQPDNSCIYVTTSRGKFRAEIFIDACGYDSILASQKGHFMDKWQWQNLVYIFENIETKIDTQKFIFYDRRIITKNNPIFWMEPYSNDKALIGAYYLVKNEISETEIENELNQYVRFLGIKGCKTKVIRGMIPLYDNTPLVYNNSILIGSAGSIISPGTAFGLISSLESGSLSAPYVARTINGQRRKKELFRFQKDWWNKNKLIYTFGQVSLMDQVSNHAPNDFQKHFSFTKHIVHNENDIFTRWQMDEINKKDIIRFIKLAYKKFSLPHIYNRLSIEDFIKMMKNFSKLQIYLVLKNKRN